MNEEEIKKLENKLSEIIIEKNNLNRSKLKKGKEKIKEKYLEKAKDSINFSSMKLIENFKLMNFDLHIKDQYYDIEFFIFNVENIIRKERQKLSEEN
jgi:hypothetical protein